MRVDEARKDNGVRRVHHLGILDRQAGADGGDPVAFDEDVTDLGVRTIVIHRQDGAALEQRAPCVLRAHVRFPSQSRDRLRL